MSQAGAIASLPDTAETRAEWALRPVWLRPAAIALALALHAAAAAFIAAPVLPASPIDAIDVTLVAQGDAAEEKQARDEAKPAEPAAPPAPPAEAAPQLAAPAARIEAPEAVPLPLAALQTEAIATPKAPVVVHEPVVVQEKDVSPAPAEWRERRRQLAEAAERRHKAEAAQLAERLGAEQGRAAASAASRASYASLLSAELNRHKIYPPSARAAGVTGSVGVAFTVGAQGEVVSHAITRSSGSPALDGAVEAMIAAVRAPPPPGGSFHASTTVNFSIQ